MAKWSRLRILADSLADAYWTWNSGGGDNLNNSMVLKNAVALTASPTLEYSVKYSIEDGYDYAYIEISKDGGENWDILKTYTDVLEEWGSETIDLSAYINYSVIVRARYETDRSISLGGLDIKNITIKNNGNSLFTDTGNVNDWTLVGFDWVEKDPMIPYGTISYRESSMGYNNVDKEIYSVWMSREVVNNVGLFSLKFSKSTNTGVDWTTPSNIVEPTPYRINNPFIIVDGEIIYLVYTGQDATYTDKYQIKFQKSTDGGATWSSAINIQPIAGYYQGFPSIEKDLTGSLHVAWFGYDVDSSTEQNLKYSKSTDDGVSWSVWINIFTDLNNIDQGSEVNDSWSDNAQPLYPNLKVDSQNNLHLVWFGYGGGSDAVKYTKSTDSGATWSDWENILSELTIAVDKTPKMIIDSNDRIHVVVDKRREDGYGRISYIKSEDLGDTWSSEIVVAEHGDEGFGNFPYNPDITCDSLGHLHVVWYNPEIYYRLSTDGGATWGEIITMPFGDLTYYVLRDPHIICHGINNVHLLCVCESDGTNNYNWEPLYANYLVDVAPSLTIPKKCAMRVLINGLWRRVIKR